MTNDYSEKEKEKEKEEENDKVIPRGEATPPIADNVAASVLFKPRPYPRNGERDPVCGKQMRPTASSKSAAPRIMSISSRR
jgi:hypothetical protein